MSVLTVIQLVCFMVYGNQDQTSNTQVCLSGLPKPLCPEYALCDKLNLPIVEEPDDYYNKLDAKTKFYSNRRDVETNGYSVESNGYRLNTIPQHDSKFPKLKQYLRTLSRRKHLLLLRGRKKLMTQSIRLDTP